MKRNEARTEILAVTRADRTLWSKGGGGEGEEERKRNEARINEFSKEVPGWLQDPDPQHVEEEVAAEKEKQRAEGKAALGE